MLQRSVVLSLCLISSSNFSLSHSVVNHNVLILFSYDGSLHFTHWGFFRKDAEERRETEASFALCSFHIYIRKTFDWLERDPSICRSYCSGAHLDKHGISTDTGTALLWPPTYPSFYILRCNSLPKRNLWGFCSSSFILYALQSMLNSTWMSSASRSILKRERSKRDQEDGHMRKDGGQTQTLVDW